MDTPDNTSAILVSDPSQATDNSDVNTQNQSVDWEKRFKDTQAAYTKKSQENVELKAKLAVRSTVPVMSDSEKDRLEDLKYTDPDTWRKELGELEAKATQTYNEQLQVETSKLTALEQRELTYNNFLASHPDVTINDDVITYDVPKRITSKLESGEITFETYLEEVYAYLKAPKVIGSSTTSLDQPNLS